jgi:hypothetical protein
MSAVTVSRAGEMIDVRVPMRLRKRGGRKRIVVPEGSEPTATQPNYHDALVLALARGHLWNELLESGEFGSISEIAETVGLDAAYVARLMRLILLSPDIVKAVVEGKEPSGLTYRALAKPFLVLWDEQLTALGFVGDG